MMELFTLGADRGYSQHDVHKQARALTGFTNNWSDAAAPTTSASTRRCTTTGSRRSSASAGALTIATRCRLCVDAPHPPVVHGRPSCGATSSASRSPRRRCACWSAPTSHSGFEVRPLMEAILRHPLFYEGARMVIPPVVYCAGLLRALAADRSDQRLGLDRRADRPAAVRAAQRRRLGLHPLAGHLALGGALHRGQLRAAGQRASTRTPSTIRRARDAGAGAGARRWPTGATRELSATTRSSALLAFSRRAQRTIRADWEQVPYRVLRQNALRALIPITPDWQTC